MGSIYYTSDFHLNHKLVAELRGFPDTETHDAWITELWDSTITKNDQVIFLGDLAMTRHKDALAWLDERPGIKHLITGNHDSVFPRHKTAWRDLPRWQQHFRTIQQHGVRRFAGEKVLLSHFPYASHGDGLERKSNRYGQYRLPDEGKFLLHGHTHATNRAYDNMFHVGLDAWGRFVHQDEIITAFTDWNNQQIDKELRRA